MSLASRLPVGLALSLALASAGTGAESPYPLQPGNSWYYRHTTQQGAPTSFSVAVLAETTAAGGNVYAVLSRWDVMGGEYCGSRYVRADSSRVYYLDTAAGHEDTVLCLTCATTWYFVPSLCRNYGGGTHDTLPDTVLYGAPHQQHHFELLGLIHGMTLTLVSGVGLVQAEEFCPPIECGTLVRNVDTLVGCVIGGVPHGDTPIGAARGSPSALARGRPRAMLPGEAAAFDLTGRRIARNCASGVVLTGFRSCLATSYLWERAHQSHASVR